jgi:hypothetical protein
MNADGGPLDKARTMQGGFPEPCSLVMKHFGSQRSPSNYMKISQMIFFVTISYYYPWGNILSNWRYTYPPEKYESQIG